MTEYNLEGERWIPFHEVKKIYKVKFHDLLDLVEKEIIRFRTFNNPHSDKQFKAYSVLDLEENLEKKEKVNLETQWF